MSSFFNSKSVQHICLRMICCTLMLMSFPAKAKKSCNCSDIQNGKQGLSYVKEMLASDDPACKELAYEEWAAIFLDANQADSMHWCLLKAQELLKSEGCNEKAFINFYKLYANYHRLRSEFDLELKYTMKVLTALEAENNTQELPEAYLVISQIFNKTGQVKQGISYCRKSIPYIDRLQDQAQKAALYERVAGKYYYYFQDFKDETYLDTTEMYATKALNISKQCDDPALRIRAYFRMNGVAYNRGKVDLAIHYIDSALAECSASTAPSMMAVLYGDKGNLYRNMKQYGLARRYADSSLKFYKQSQIPEQIANCYALIYNIESEQGNYKEALHAVEQYQEIKDSIGNADQAAVVAELEKKYNQAKNEKTIRELAQQKQIYLLLIIAALLGVSVLIFFLRQQNLKHKQRILETEQRLNRARMNPHFFFNALASLQSFAMRENDGKALASNLSKFSHIMRETLESTYKDYVSIEQEMDFLNEYIEIQSIRYPQKFTYRINAHPDLEIDDILIPSMILQPFVENSIEHGFSGIDHEGHIEIYFEQDAQSINISIQDNGKGLQTNASNDHPEHISRASQIIKDRFYLLNIKLKTKASFSIDNITSGNGVIVKINLPLMYKENQITPKNT
ncbi:MAG: histidine kinase [Chitinophagaceae bacterium]|nr:histidine kinase [Chitinophagaceae bacterium]